MIGDASLDMLSTGVILLDDDLCIVELNSAAEGLFSHSRRGLIGQSFTRFVEEPPELLSKLHNAIEQNRGFSVQDVTLGFNGTPRCHVDCLVTPIESRRARLVLELRSIDQQRRIEREAVQLSQSQANRELIRNLAHEIKNPLGGLRGSAQLLERELDRSDLREYTQVIIKEADRLQSLMERLLSPHRLPKRQAVNIHEVCERVRSLVLAEFPANIRVRRDYDVSLPELYGDREQLIQVVLNIARNAAQAILAQPALTQPGTIVLRTRAVHRVTIARTLHKVVCDLQVIDDGPGIAESIRERVFYPLVSGRPDGTGLGLTLAMNFVEYHRGVIECDSRPGRTVFRILLPVQTENVVAEREVVQ